MNMQTGDVEKILMEIHSKVSRIETNSEATYKAIFGNGQPGLKEEFTILKTECGACKDGRKKSFAIMVASISLLAPVATWLFKITFGV